MTLLSTLAPDSFAPDGVSFLKPDVGFSTLTQTGTWSWSARSVPQAPIVRIATMSTGVVFLPLIQNEGREFLLRQPLRLDIEEDGSYVVAVYPALGIQAFGGTLEDALEAFEMEFVAIWDHLVGEPERNLTIDARALRRTIRRLVRSARSSPP